jgi:hypothetical protein
MIACEDDAASALACVAIEESVADSNPDYFQELKFLHRLINIALKT